MDVFVSQSGRTIRKGNRVHVKSRHGTVGNGTVIGFRESHTLAPDTILVEMDADTVYADNNRGYGWAHDRERIPTFGLYGGEIDHIIKPH